MIIWHGKNKYDLVKKELQRAAILDNFIDEKFLGELRNEC